MMTARPELFLGNPDPAHVLPIDDYYVQGLRRLGSEIITPYYVRPDPLNSGRDLAPPRHIIAEMCQLAGLSGRVSLRPYLNLTAIERQAGRICHRQVAMHSTGLGAALPYPAKEWGVERFAEVARRLAPDFNVVQLGSRDDPPLPAVYDLRGRSSLRKAAAVLAESLCFVGLEGFLPHLARAVECPAVVIFGGRARPEIFGYEANCNLYSALECAPCGLRSGCPHDLKCMQQITPEEVEAAVRTLCTRPAGPLPVGSAAIP
jgi:hypothetical protein